MNAEQIHVGDLVYGDAGVFYRDYPAYAVILNTVEPDCIHVEFEDGTRAVVPAKSVEVIE